MSTRGEKTVWDANTKRHNEKLQEAADLKKYIKVGDWNDVVLTARGNHITYRINGHLMTYLIDDSPKALREGVLAFQLHQGYTMEVQFKDVKRDNLIALVSGQHRIADFTEVTSYSRVSQYIYGCARSRDGRDTAR